MSNLSNYFAPDQLQHLSDYSNQDLDDMESIIFENNLVL